jgi:hypothetical protein
MPAGNAFLDLDVVRRELGLPGVFPLSGTAVAVVPDRKISETILEFAQPIRDRSAHSRSSRRRGVCST